MYSLRVNLFICEHGKGINLKLNIWLIWLCMMEGWKKLMKDIRLMRVSDYRTDHNMSIDDLTKKMQKTMKQVKEIRVKTEQL